MEPRREQLTPGRKVSFPSGRSPEAVGLGGRVAARWIGTLALAGSLWLAGCVAPGRDGARPSTGGGMGDITREELDRDSYGTAYRAIERLRRTWLRRRGAQTAYNLDNRPAVYLNGVRMPFTELYGISDDYIERISLLSPTDATTRFGTDHTAGAIMIVTRRAPPG